jgi:hypothetical protein
MVRTLFDQYISRLGEPEDSYTRNPSEHRQHGAFEQLLRMFPGLEQRLLTSSDDDITHIAELIQKGSSQARSDDSKSLKLAVVDWIAPRGQALSPPLSRHAKNDRGFQHERTGELLCPVGWDWSNTETKAKLRNGEIELSGDQWPIFLYHDYVYNPKDPWRGLLRSRILVSAYKHVFTSPSSVEKELKATRSGNARIHGMTKVTPASIAYVATQVRFVLSSSPVFFRGDFEKFYNTILDLLDDVDEREEVNDLLTWWNCQIFPTHLSSSPTAGPTVRKNSTLAMIKETLVELRANTANGQS